MTGECSSGPGCTIFADAPRHEHRVGVPETRRAEACSQALRVHHDRPLGGGQRETPPVKPVAMDRARRQRRCDGRRRDPVTLRDDGPVEAHIATSRSRKSSPAAHRADHSSRFAASREGMHSHAAKLLLHFFAPRFSSLNGQPPNSAPATTLRPPHPCRALRLLTRAEASAVLDGVLGRQTALQRTEIHPHQP